MCRQAACPPRIVNASSSQVFARSTAAPISRFFDVRIESVTSVAFGPFRNVALEFSPGLTVVYGPNEAGKSRWHAATYAPICGIRRWPVQPCLEERDCTDL